MADLVSSMTVNISYNVSDPNIGLSQSKDMDSYKLFIADTGLFITLAFRDKAFTDNIIYQQLLSDKLATNLGYVYENVVAQMLRASGNELYYHTFPTDSGKHNYEIDFLLARHNKICPVEVKSSGYKAHVLIKNPRQVPDLFQGSGQGAGTYLSAFLHDPVHLTEQLPYFETKLPQPSVGMIAAVFYSRSLTQRRVKPIPLSNELRGPT